MRKRTGIRYENNKPVIMLAIVTGVMSDGSKVWTECDNNGELINKDKQYLLKTGGGCSEFVDL